MYLPYLVGTLPHFICFVSLNKLITLQANFYTVSVPRSALAAVACKSHWLHRSPEWPRTRLVHASSVRRPTPGATG